MYEYNWKLENLETESNEKTAQYGYLFHGERRDATPWHNWRSKLFKAQTFPC